MNNSFDNIAIGIASENMMDRPKEERVNHAIRAASHLRKFTDKEIADMRIDRANGATYKDIMEKYGITPESPPSKQIEAGAKYLNELEKWFSETIPDSLERIKFVLAAYNTGPGHVFDAQRLAKKYGKDA